MADRQRRQADGAATVKGLFAAVWILFLVSWTIYPLGYLMPQISASAEGS